MKTFQQYLDAAGGDAERALRNAVADGAEREGENGGERDKTRAEKARADKAEAALAVYAALGTPEELEGYGEALDTLHDALAEAGVDVTDPAKVLPTLKGLTEKAGRAETAEKTGAEAAAKLTLIDAAGSLKYDPVALKEFLGARSIAAEGEGDKRTYVVVDGENRRPLSEVTERFAGGLRIAGEGDRPRKLPTGGKGDNVVISAAASHVKARYSGPGTTKKD